MADRHPSQRAVKDRPNGAGRSLGAGRLYRDEYAGGRWALDWKDAQGTRRRLVLSEDKRVAERMRSEIINQRDLELAGLGSIEGQSRDLLELLDLYLADLMHRAHATHVKAVDVTIRKMLKVLRATRVRDLRPIDLMQYRAELVRQGKGNRTVNMTFGKLKALLNWAASANLIAENPIRHFKPLPYQENHWRRARRALSDEEIERLLTAAESDDAEFAAYVAAETTIANSTKGADYAERRRPPRAPQAIFFRTLLDTGARWSELTSATWADLNRERLTLRLRATTTKSGKTRIIPLRAELVTELWAPRSTHQHARERMAQPTDPIFLTPEAKPWLRETNNARRIFYRVLDRAGIARQSTDGVIDLHALRHTAASRMARNSVPLTVTQRILGHSDPSLTARVYTHLDVEDLRAALIAATTRAARTRSA